MIVAESARPIDCRIASGNLPLAMTAKTIRFFSRYDQNLTQQIQRSEFLS
jgi:hypothetical protein